MFPSTPTPGQRYTDQNGIDWLYDGVAWSSLGVAHNIPDASTTNAGLMSSKLKLLLNTSAEHYGGFGIIINPLASGSVIQGDINLVSNTLDIDCVQTHGNAEKCIAGISAAEGISNQLAVKLSDAFLNSLKLEICGPAGLVGDDGLTGSTGKPGTGDGPRGRDGPDGVDNNEPIPLSGLRFVDDQEVVSTAVVDLKLVDGNKLHIVSSKIKTADSVTPADLVVAAPSIRTIEIEDGFAGFTLSGDDLAVCLQGSQLAPVSFSGLVGELVSRYRNELTKADVVYRKQSSDLITSLDAKARTILNELAGELSDCEMELAPPLVVSLQNCDELPPSSPSSPVLDRSVRLRRQAKPKLKEFKPAPRSRVSRNTATLSINGIGGLLSSLGDVAHTLLPARSGPAGPVELSGVKSWSTMSVTNVPGAVVRGAYAVHVGQSDEGYVLHAFVKLDIYNYSYAGSMVFYGYQRVHQTGPWKVVLDSLTVAEKFPGVSPPKSIAVEVLV